MPGINERQWLLFNNCQALWPWPKHKHTCWETNLKLLTVAMPILEISKRETRERQEGNKTELEGPREEERGTSE